MQRRLALAFNALRLMRTAGTLCAGVYRGYDGVACLGLGLFLIGRLDTTTPVTEVAVGVLLVGHVLPAADVAFVFAGLAMS
ncbi:MAG: hypothetical protein AAGU08_14750 [Sporomusa sphaeroides]